MFPGSDKSAAGSKSWLEAALSALLVALWPILDRVSAPGRLDRWADGRGDSTVMLVMLSGS